jgi:hypothetical protein
VVRPRSSRTSPLSPSPPVASCRRAPLSAAADMVAGVSPAPYS